MYVMAIHSGNYVFFHLLAMLCCSYKQVFDAPENKSDTKENLN